MVDLIGSTHSATLQQHRKDALVWRYRRATGRINSTANGFRQNYGPAADTPADHFITGARRRALRGSLQATHHTHRSRRGKLERGTRRTFVGLRRLEPSRVSSHVASRFDRRRAQSDSRVGRRSVGRDLGTSNRTIAGSAAHVGCGRMGVVQALAAQRLGAQVAVVCDPDIARHALHRIKSRAD